MRPLSTKINLMLRERIIKIHEKEYLSDKLKREGFAALPTNCVINKMLPGLGAIITENRGCFSAPLKCYLFLYLEIKKKILRRHRIF